MQSGTCVKEKKQSSSVRENSPKVSSSCDTNEQEKASGNRKVWNLSKDNMESLMKTSDKFAGLQNEYANEFPTLISPQK